MSQDERFEHGNAPPQAKLFPHGFMVMHAARESIYGLYAIALAIREVAAAIREHKPA